MQDDMFRRYEKVNRSYGGDRSTMELSSWKTNIKTPCSSQSHGLNGTNLSLLD